MNWADLINEAASYGYDPYGEEFDPNQLLIGRAWPSRLRVRGVGTPPFVPQGSVAAARGRDIHSQSSMPDEELLPALGIPLEAVMGSPIAAAASDIPPAQPASAAQVAPVLRRRDVDPNAAIQRRAKEYEAQLRPRKKRELVTEFAQPILQSLAAALGQPGYRRNRAFWSSLLTGGGQLALSEVMRPRLLRQAALDQALKEAAVNARVTQAMKPTYGEYSLRPALDRQTGKTVYATPEMIQSDPQRYGIVPKEPTEHQPQFRDRTLPTGDTQTERWDQEKGDWIPTESLESPPLMPSPTVAGPAQVGTTVKPISGPGMGRVPTIGAKGQVAKAKETAKKVEPDWKNVTLADGTLAIVDMNGDSPTFGTAKKTKLKGYNPPKPERETEIRRELTSQAEGLATAVWDQAAKTLPPADAHDPVKVANKALELARAYPGKTQNAKAAKLAREIMPMIEARIKARLPVRPWGQMPEDQLTPVPVFDMRTGQRVKVFPFEIEADPKRYRRVQAE